MVCESAVLHVPPRPIAVIRDRKKLTELRERLIPLYDRVYEAARSGVIARGWHNLVVFRGGGGDDFDVELGIQAAERLAGKGRTMNKEAKSRSEAEMLEEYDFSKGVRGKYAERYPRGTNVAVVSPDVAESFLDSESVNEALRTLVMIARKTAKKHSASCLPVGRAAALGFKRPLVWSRVGVDGVPPLTSPATTCYYSWKS